MRMLATLYAEKERKEKEGDVAIAIYGQLNGASKGSFYKKLWEVLLNPELQKLEWP